MSMLSRCVARTSRRSAYLRQQQQQQRLFLSTSTTQNQQHHQQQPSRFSQAAVSAAKLHIPTLSSAFDHQLWIPKRGTGFDHFIPKNGKDSDESDGDEKGSEGSGNKKNDKKNRNTGGGGGNNPFWSAVALMALTYAFLQIDSFDENSNSNNGASSAGGGAGSTNPLLTQTITWNDLHLLLETNQIEKVWVTQDKTMAKIILNVGAPGLSSVTTSSSATPMPAGNTHPDDDSNNSNQFTTHTEYSSNSQSQSQQQQPQRSFRLAIGSIESLETKLQDAQFALGRPRQNHVPIQYSSTQSLANEMMGVVPSLIIMAIVFGFMRGALSGRGGAGGGPGGMFQIGKSTAKKVAPESVSTTFADVAGCQEAKKEIMEFVDFLGDPTQFTKLGAKIPKGALLCGPPGTGKTLLAKAVAGEAGVPFFSISGSDFIEMFVGVGPSRVRDLFSEARNNAPCIVFIDEIDAVGRQRGRGGVGGNDERENTLNQLLVEMDGFSPSTGVVVLAGTNRVDILDQALTRPGRFDRQIMVDKPDVQGRREIFKVHLKELKLEDEMDEIAGRLAGLTPGFAGADIANICNEAAIVAARRNADSVALADFETATDRVIGGLESNKLMSNEEKKIVAFHEAGHAVAGWFLEHADPLLKVTIIPRSNGALGFAQYLPKEIYLRTQEQIMDTVSMALAGRAAEQISFGRVTTGASDDLKRVTEMVYSTIQLYGMNDRLGQLAFPKDPNAMFDDRPYSDKTANAMDEEAKQIIDEAYERTVQLLTSKKEQVEAVANLLLEKETITHDDMIELIGPRPFKADPQYEEFIKRRKIIREEQEAKENAEDESASSGPENLSPGLAFR